MVRRKSLTDPYQEPAEPAKKCAAPSPEARAAPLWQHLPGSLTKYERVRVIGSRAQQLARGATPLIHVRGVCDPLVIAEQEFSKGLLKSILVRPMPDGSEERHSLSSLLTRGGCGLREDPQ